MKLPSDRDIQFHQELLYMLACLAVVLGIGMLTALAWIIL